MFRLNPVDPEFIDVEHYANLSVLSTMGDATTALGVVGAVSVLIIGLGLYLGISDKKSVTYSSIHDK